MTPLERAQAIHRLVGQCLELASGLDECGEMKRHLYRVERLAELETLWLKHHPEEEENDNDNA